MGCMELVAGRTAPRDYSNIMATANLFGVHFVRGCRVRTSLMGCKRAMAVFARRLWVAGFLWLLRTMCMGCR